MNEFPVENSDLSQIISVQLTRKERNEHLKCIGGVDALCQKLKTNPMTGLSTDDKVDLDARRHQFGTNDIIIKKPKSFLRLIWLAYHDNLLIVLTICAFISIILSFFNADSCDCYPQIHKRNILSEWIDGIAILIAVLIVLLVTAFNNWTKEKQFRSLQLKLDQEHKINVLRDSLIREIQVRELLVGDVCILTIGNLAPADGVVIQANDLKIDESNITGESDLIEKGHDDFILFSGTKVMTGSGKMLITAVGIHTQSGIILTTLKHIKKDITKSQSILQAKLTKLSIQIGYAGIFVSFATFFALLIRFLITESDSIHDYKYVIQQVIDFLIVGISILVLAIPEGLPLAVTISLAYAVRKMINDHNLVRHLDACETMGSATSICSDKTGTLTTNQMTVTESYINGEFLQDLSKLDKLPNEIKEILANAIAINTSYSSRLEQDELRTQVGNKTECSLLALVERLGFNYDLIRQQYTNERILHIHTFNSDRKYMATCVNHPNKRIFVKGASEKILNRSKYVILNDEIIPIDPLKPAIFNAIKLMSVNGLRTVIIAYKDITDEKLDFDRDEESLINDLVFICLCGIEDPVRKEVPDAIQDCKNAGIIVRMVTGDNVDTARSIAIKCGIIDINSNFLVLDSKEYNDLIKNEQGQVMQEKIDLVWPQLRVLARASPEDKYILVKHIISSRINENREVVAVTGDGTNDGPALKMADVGFAMGIQGTDVAKEASDIILTDDNFNSIVKAVMWGRNVHDSISKFIQFQLTVNIVAVLAEFFGACIGKKPLNGVQMLWINLIMDSLASLALATDPPSKNLLNRLPYSRTSPIISRQMVRNIFFQCVYQLSVIIVILTQGPRFIRMDTTEFDSTPFIPGCSCAKKFHEPTEHLTIVLNTFVLMTLFNEINSRKIHGEHNIFRGLLSNPIFCVIWLTTLGIQILMINYGGYAFAVKRLSLEQWGWCILFGLGTLVFQQLVTSFPKRKVPERTVDIKELEKFTPKEVIKTGHGKILWLRGYKKLKAVNAFDYKRI